MADEPDNMKIEKRGTAEFVPIADLGVPPIDGVPVAPLERAARALHQALGLDWPYVYDDAAMKEIARAVLTAIREPSEAILRAMRDTVPVDGHEWEYRDEEAVAHWQALIDAALAEEG